MKTTDPIRTEFHRGRTDARLACADYDTYRTGGSKDRTQRQAGEDCRRRLAAAIRYFTAAYELVDADLESGTDPVPAKTPGSAPDLTEGDHA